MPVSIVLCRPGGTPVDLVKAGWSAVRYSTVVSGGFGSAVLVAPGDARKIVPRLGTIRILNDDRLLFEGLVEDREYAADASSQTTTVTAFGKQRLLQLASLRRMWSIRALPFQRGTDYGGGVMSSLLSVAAGFCDPNDVTKRGIRVAGQGSSITVGASDPFQAAHIVPPDGLPGARVKGTFLHGGSVNILGQITVNDSAGTYTILFGGALGTATSQDFDLVLPSTAVRIIFAGGVQTTQVYAMTDFAEFSNIRLLGTTITEDTSGGFYAATLLRDVLSFVPGISAGQIDTGLEFIIQQLERTTRSNAKSIIDEVASYFTREWAVWEDGRFDWKDPNLFEAGWTIALGDTISCRIKESVDGLARDTYLTYVDPVDQRQKEAAATTTRLGNDFYRTGLLSDDIEAPGLAFTPTTAALYARAANDRLSRIPAAQGNVVVPAWKMLPRSNGGAAPAVEIRAGENITIPDMPVDDAFSGGADNMSLFHVVQSDVDLSAGTVTLTIAGYLPGLDVLTARLNAVTKVATS